MKIVAIGGSPRKQGNSNSLLRVAVEAAVGRGAQAEYFYPREMDIRGCLACDGCRRDPQAVCVQKDDMHRIYEAIKASDVVVFATPVYFYSFSSWLKEVLDRLYALITPDSPDGEKPYPSRVEPGKGFYLITSQEEQSPFYAYNILSVLTYGMTWIRMEHRGQLLATGLDGPDDWKDRANLIAAAERLIAV